MLGPDHPVTGGYPLIGVLRRQDLGALQLRCPGAALRLRLHLWPLRLNLGRHVLHAALFATPLAAQTARLVASLNTMSELAAGTARSPQGDIGPIMAEISTAMRQLRLIVLTDVVTAFGFEPAALDSNYRDANAATTPR